MQPTADAAAIPGTELDERGHAQGRDPRRMTQAELRAMGHQPMSAHAALRLHCLDCCTGSADEVRKCTATRCPSWPFRMGRNPWRAPLSDEQLEARRQQGLALARKMHSGASA